MLRTRINLECEACDDSYPCVGLCPAPLDAAIFTEAELRREAKDAGWSRSKGENSQLEDLCPRCTKRAKKGKF